MPSEHGAKRNGLQGNEVKVLHKLAQELPQKVPEFYLPRGGKDPRTRINDVHDFPSDEFPSTHTFFLGLFSGVTGCGEGWPKIGLAGPAPERRLADEGPERTPEDEAGTTPSLL